VSHRGTLSAMRLRSSAFALACCAASLASLPGTALAANDGESPADLARSGRGKPIEVEVGKTTITPFALFRAGYDRVGEDPKVDFVGRNNGFWLESARLGFEATSGSVTTRVSFEGASGAQLAPNTPEGSLRVSLRDAFVRWEVSPALAIQLGQAKAPWAREELRGVQERPFATNAVGFEGVAAGRGYDQPSLALDRQLGLIVTAAKPIEAGGLRFDYAAMLANGNGRNQLVDDNGKPLVVGRVELGYLAYATLGAGAYMNDRRVGTAPNLYDERDVGFVVDLMSKVENLELLATYAQVGTAYPTTGAPDRKQVAWHAQASYRFDWTAMPFAIGYRIAHFSPYAQAGAALPGGANLTDYDLDHHTVGVRLFHATLPLSLYANYTLTLEPSTRALANDRATLLAQMTF
jgi:hypothetical protein